MDELKIVCAHLYKKFIIFNNMLKIPQPGWFNWHIKTVHDKAGYSTKGSTYQLQKGRFKLRYLSLLYTPVTFSMWHAAKLFYLSFIVKVVIFLNMLFYKNGTYGLTSRSALRKKQDGRPESWLALGSPRHGIVE